MHKSGKFVVAILLTILVIVPQVFAVTIPAQPSGYVNDYAHMLSAEQASQISISLHNLEQQTSDQIVVATFDSLDGQALDDFSINLADKWKIGQKGKDNGAILLIIKQDHKIRIEVGYGLEGVLTDAATGIIIRHQIVPYFKQHLYYQGINSAVHALSATLHSPVADASQTVPVQTSSFGNEMFSLCIIFIPILLYCFISVLGNSILSCVHMFSKSKVSYSNHWFGPHAFFRLTFLGLLNFIQLILIILSSRGSGSGGGFGGGDSLGDGDFGGGGGDFGGGGADGGW